MSNEIPEVPPDPIWDDWETLPLVPEIPVLHLDGFDGPMNVLLDLAERQRIDFGKMSVADLATQFVAAMEQFASKVPIERRADWLVLATRLILLRARLLFPKTAEAAVEAEREEAAELRLIGERMAMRAATTWLQARPQLGFDIFSRPAVTPKPPGSGYVALMEACLVVLRSTPQQAQEPPVSHRPPLKFWLIGDALERIETLLGAWPEGGGMMSFLPEMERQESRPLIKVRVAIASTFAAGLELAKQQCLRAEQDDTFHEIHFRAAEQICAASGTKYPK